MSMHRRGTSTRSERLAAFCSLLTILLYSFPAPAQQKEVLTFEGVGDSPIRILNEKGEIKEEVSQQQLKMITVKPKLIIPQRRDKPTEEKKPADNSVLTAKSDPTIDEMLKTRRENLKKRRAYADRPPRKRRK